MSHEDTLARGRVSLPKNIYCDFLPNRFIIILLPFTLYFSVLEDKATACQMLVCYARELKEAFAPYVEEVLNTMLPMLTLCLNDEVCSLFIHISVVKYRACELSNRISEDTSCPFRR